MYLFPTLSRKPNRKRKTRERERESTISWESGLAPVSLHCVKTILWSWSIWLWKSSLCESNDFCKDSAEVPICSSEKSSFKTFIGDLEAWTSQVKNGGRICFTHQEPGRANNWFSLFSFLELGLGFGNLGGRKRKKKKKKNLFENTKRGCDQDRSGAGK